MFLAKLNLITRLSYLPLFWRFQLGGWLAFSLLTLPLKIQLLGSVPGALFLSVIREGSSLLLTLGMRVLYQKAFPIWTGPGKITLVILGVSLIGGLFQTGFFLTLHVLLPFDDDNLYSAPWEFEVFYERTGLLLGWSALYCAIRQMRENMQNQLRLAWSEAEQQKTEMQMLRAQMDPHFLFNALDTILATLDRREGRAAKMLQSLADYLNYSLTHRNKSFVSLGEECDALTNFLTLERSRLGEDLDFASDIDPASRNAQVPGIFLQPLVENAIKFGRDTSGPTVMVRLNIKHETPDLLIEVTNIGRWLTPDTARTSGGVGLENIQRRLERLYPNSHSLGIIQEEGWVSVHIRIPAEK